MLRNREDLKKIEPELEQEEGVATLGVVSLRFGVEFSGGVINKTTAAT